MIVHNRTYTCCIATYINSTYSCIFSLSAALGAIFFIFYFVFLHVYLLCFLIRNDCTYTCCIFAFFVASIGAIFRPLPALNHNKYRCYTSRSRLSAGIHATLFNPNICSYRCNVFSFWMLNVSGIDAICSEALTRERRTERTATLN